MEVYSDLDKQRLKESVSENWHELDSNDVSKETLGETEDTDKTISEVANETNKELENPATTDNPNDQTLESEPVPNVSFDNSDLDFIRRVGTRSNHFSKEFN